MVTFASQVREDIAKALCLNQETASTRPQIRHRLGLEPRALLPQNSGNFLLFVSFPAHGTFSQLPDYTHTSIELTPGKQ